LIGGALLAGGTTYLFKRRDEKREVKAAVRLVESELRMAEGALSAIAPLAAEFESAESEREKSKARRSLRARITSSYTQVTDEAWQESRMLLGRHLDPPEWDALRAAYVSLAILWAPDQEALSEEGDPVLDDATLELEAAIASDLLGAGYLERARAVCQRHADLPPVEIPAPR